MDLMLVALSFFTMVITGLGGYLIIQKFFPNRNREIEITKAFKDSNFNKVIMLTEGKESDIKNSLNVYSFAAQARSQTGLYSEAIKWWELALVRLELSKEDRIFIELAIGDEFFALDDLKKAEVHYRTAVTLFPEHEKANYKLAQILYFQDQFEQCRKTLRPVLKRNPLLIDSRELYAECLASLGLYAKAIRHYGLLERINEHNITYNYARTLKKLKIWE